jgi:N-acetylneuraminic acid mutarotase
MNRYIYAAAILLSGSTPAVQAIWTQKADLGGVVRQGAVGFSIGDKGYVATGLSGNTRLNDLWQYDPQTNLWTQKANVGWDNRAYAVAFSLDGKGYVATGDEQTNSSSDVLEYTPETNTWAVRANFLGSGRSSAVAFVAGPWGFVGTGANNSAIENDLFRYSPSTNSWGQVADLPGGGRYQAAAFSLGNKGYIATGLQEGGVVLNDLWEYDWIINTWTQKASMPDQGRAGAFAFSVGGRGFVGAGYYSAFPLNDFWEYNPATNTWTVRETFVNFQRTGAATFTIGDNAYLSCGWSSGVTKRDLWLFTPFSPEMNVTQNATNITDGGTFAYGNVGAGSISTKTFTIQNTGDGPLELTSTPRVTVSGSGFSLVTDAPASIPAGGSGTFSVAFDPPSCGSFSGSISIANSDANEGPYNFNLSGNGIDDGAPVPPTLPTLTGACGVSAPTPSATDECVGTVTGTTTDPTNFATQGTYTINWTFTDFVNNSVTVQQTVIVQDNIDPVVMCTGDQTVDLQAGTTDYTVQGPLFDPTYSMDNCGISGITLSNSVNGQSSLAGAQLLPGVTTVTWTVTDLVGNTASCSFQVTVNGGNSVAETATRPLQLHPNPTTGLVRFDLPAASVARVEVLDVAGRIIMGPQVDLQRGTIDMRSVNAGIYWLLIRTREVTYSARIVKE